MNVADINKRIAEIHNLIPSFDTDERKEIKKNESQGLLLHGCRN